MFTNLIESNSHKREFKRRTSFFVATVAAYALILTAAGIVGIVTYDARVDAQNMDLLVSWIPPVKPAFEPEGPRPTRPRPARPNARPNAPIDPHIQVAERTQPTAAATDPEKIPDEIGTKGSDQPPVTGPVVQSTRNADPPSAAGDKDSCAICPSETPTSMATKPTSEPTPEKPAGPQRVTSIVLAGKAISLPKPIYSTFAKQIRAQGPVNVQVLVSEDGSVMSAHAMSGNPALLNAAVDAAKHARFTPTILNGQAVKVQGVIIYNFVLQ
jgi:protein TonB